MSNRKKHSPETRKKISRAMRIRILPPEWKDNIRQAVIARCAKEVYCNETKKRFESISEAARRYGLAPIQVSRVCHGKRNKVHGLSFTFL